MASRRRHQPRLKCPVVNDPHSEPVAQERQQVAAPAEAPPGEAPRERSSERAGPGARLAEAVDLQAQLKGH